MDKGIVSAIFRQLEALCHRIDEIAPRVAPQAFSIEQVAQQLAVSCDTVRRWTQSGDLPVFKCRGIVRVRRRDLEKFLKKQTWSA